MSSLDLRVARLEAQEAIRQRIYRYALAGDRHNDREILSRLFAQDAVYELVGMGRFEGREAILDGLAEIARSAVLWSFHVPGGPLIELNEDLTSAEVFWWVWCPARVQEADGSARAYWGGVHYNGEMRPEDGAWKFSRLILETRLRTPFEGPWTEIEGPFHWPR